MGQSQATSKSHKSVRLEGRPTAHGQKKENHNISVTPDGWAGLQALAPLKGCSSISELIEKVGREELLVQDPQQGAPQSETNIEKAQELDMFMSVLEKLLPRTLEAVCDKYVSQVLDKEFSKQATMTAKIEEQLRRIAQSFNYIISNSTDERMLRLKSQNTKDLSFSTRSESPYLTPIEETEVDSWPSGELCQ